MSFKINYKGSSYILPFEYQCMSCEEHTIVEHLRKDSMKGRVCPKCGGELVRYMGKPPALGADYHESMKFRNIGWTS